MVNKYVQFIKYISFVAFMLHTLYKNSKRTLASGESIVYKTFTDEIIEYLLCKCFLCYFPLSDSKAGVVRGHSRSLKIASFDTAHTSSY